MGLEARANRFESRRLNALLLHGGKRACEAIFLMLENCGDSEIELLVTQLPTQLIESVELGLKQRIPEIRQRALVSIAKLEIAALFHQLVHSACSPRDEQQLVSSQLVVELARKLKRPSKMDRRKREIARVRLVSELSVAISQFLQHRSTLLIDAWFSCVQWDDEIVVKTFSDSAFANSCKYISQQFGRSNRDEVLAMAAGILWSKSSCDQVFELIATRCDISFLAHLADLFTINGITAQLRRSLARPVGFAFLNAISMDDDRLTIEQRCSLLGLFALSPVESAVVLQHVASLIQRFQESETRVRDEQHLANVLQNLKPVNPDVVVMALSDCMEGSDIESYVAPPWKESMRIAIESISELKPSLSPLIKPAIETLFQEFTCEQFFERLNDWPEGHLVAYARMVRMATSSFADYLTAEAQSKSPIRRARGMRAIRIFGLDEILWPLAVDGLVDENDQVRILSIQAIADGRNRRQAVEALMPLLSDRNTAISKAVSVALDSMGAMT